MEIGETVVSYSRWRTGGDSIAWLGRAGKSLHASTPPHPFGTRHQAPTLVCILAEAIVLARLFDKKRLLDWPPADMIRATIARSWGQGVCILSATTNRTAQLG